MLGERIKCFIDQIVKAYKEYKRTQAKRERILNVSHPSKFLFSEDHALFDGSSCCPLCSLYKFRIFSVSGKDKRFPSLVSLPDEIHDGKCDVCNCYYSLNPWFESIKTSAEVKSAIKQSNAPLVDNRTPEQIASFEKDQEKMRRRYYKKAKEMATWKNY